MSHTYKYFIENDHNIGFGNTFPFYSIMEREVAVMYACNLKSGIVIILDDINSSILSVDNLKFHMPGVKISDPKDILNA